MNEDVKKLVLDASNGNQIAYTKLYKTYYKTVWNTVFYVVKNQTDTDDLVSIAFTKAFMNIEKFSRFISFEMWLKTIALNTALDFIRKKKNLEYPYYLDSDENFIELESYLLDPELNMINDEISIKINSTLLKLRKRFRILLESRYIEDLSYAELANKLGVGEGTIKSELHKARKQFKKYFNNELSNTIRRNSNNKRLSSDRHIAT